MSAPYHAELAAKDFGYLRPGVGVDEIGTYMTLLDPFGNTPQVERTAG